MILAGLKQEDRGSLGPQRCDVLLPVADKTAPDKAHTTAGELYRAERGAGRTDPTSATSVTLGPWVTKGGRSILSQHLHGKTVKPSALAALRNVPSKDTNSCPSGRSAAHLKAAASCIASAAFMGCVSMKRSAKARTLSVGCISAQKALRWFRRTRALASSADDKVPSRL